MSSISETIPAALEEQRLDRVVALLADVSRAKAAELVGSGAVTVNDAPWTKVSERLSLGDRIEIETSSISTEFAAIRPDPNIEFTVVYEDDTVVVVEKPAGLVVHPGAGHHDGTMVSGLIARYPEIGTVGESIRPGIVHRLDRDTSGLLAVARTAEAYESLVAQLGDRAVTRRYLALAGGHPESETGLIDAPIGRDPRRPTLMAVRDDGKEARTRYEVLERFHLPVPLTLLECHLETGRTHQIRVHLKAIGHSIAGDGRYGGSGAIADLERPFLHATSLSFEHPRTGERVRFESDLPADLGAALSEVRDRNRRDLDVGPTEASEPSMDAEGR